VANRARGRSSICRLRDLFALAVRRSQSQSGPAAVAPHSLICENGGLLLSRRLALVYARIADGLGRHLAVLEDSQIVQVKFECCSRRLPFTLAEVKRSPNRGFVCPKCGVQVAYAVPDFVQLINKNPEDGPFEITLRQV